MKRILNFFLFTLLFVLGSCSDSNDTELGSITKDPNADNEQVIALRNILCSADNGWKMTLNGEDFYFQFRADGTVLSDSEYLYSESTSLYSVRLKNGLLYMKISGGHLAYMDENLSTTKLYISDYTDNKIESKGYNNGIDMEMSLLNDGEFEAMQAAKAPKVALNETGLLYGVIRDANNKFVSHYALDIVENKAKFDFIADGVVKHETRDLTINGELLSLSANVVLGSQTISGIEYVSDDATLVIKGTNVDGLKLTTNTGAVSYFDNRNRQFQFCKKTNTGAAHATLWEETNWEYLKTFEINCTDARKPLVAILQKGADDADLDGFIFYYSGVTGAEAIVKDEVDRIYLSNDQGPLMPFGGNAVRMEDAKEGLKEILGAWFHQDGWYLVTETDGSTEYLYFISPTTEYWIKAKKTK